MDIVSVKQDLRREAERARPALKEEASAAAAAMAENFLKSIPVKNGAKVSAYIAMRSEADPSLIVERLREQGATIVLPRVEKGKALHFHVWEKRAELIPAPFGLKEPAAHWPEADPDILIVPLLAFDTEGYRLGYGGGYYDRTISELRAKKNILAVGLAFSGQQRGDLPREAHDQPLDIVVTEKTALRFSSAG